MAPRSVHPTAPSSQSMPQPVLAGASPDELRRAKERMQAASVYARDSLSGPPNVIGAALAIGQRLDEVEAWPDRIGAVTPEEVDNAARSVLVERNSATGVLLPEPTS